MAEKAQEAGTVDEKTVAAFQHALPQVEEDEWWENDLDEVQGER